MCGQSTRRRTSTLDMAAKDPLPSPLAVGHWGIAPHPQSEGIARAIASLQTPRYRITATPAATIVGAR